MDMNSALQRKNLIVRPSTIHGYGVFAGEDINSGDIIEECYTIILDADNGIKNFSFRANGRAAMVLGCGAIYNHLNQHYNADYSFDVERSAMIYRARREIKQGEEIFINYGKDWFADRYAVAKSVSRRYYWRKFLNTLQRSSRGVIVTACLFALIYIGQSFVLTHG
jgi:hypothetical protein